jgi:hypothetical protein
MTHEEKRAWIFLSVTVIAYTTYVITILTRANGIPLAEISYQATLLWTVGGAIVAAIVAEIAMGIVTPKASREKDIRDKEIGRLGDTTGQAFVVIGAVAAMLMAMGQWDWFWIANVVYLGFVLSAIVGSVTRLFAYRGNFAQW